MTLLSNTLHMEHNMNQVKISRDEAKKAELLEKKISGFYTEEMYNLWYSLYFPKDNFYLQKIAKEFRIKSQLHR